MGIGHSVYTLPVNVDWITIQALGIRHGLSVIIIDGIERLPESKRPPKEILLEWIGEVLQGYEYRFEMYCRTIEEMANFYNGHGYGNLGIWESESGGQELSYTLGTQYIPSNESRKWAAWGLNTIKTGFFSLSE
jgi:hypothetical protein